MRNPFSRKGSTSSAWRSSRCFPAVGLDRWILLVFLAWTLAILHRQDDMTLEECAFLALVTVLPHLHLNRLLHLFSKNAEFLHQHGYSLRYARCNS